MEEQDEVKTLKEEVKRLKALLDQERSKNPSTPPPQYSPTKAPSQPSRTPQPSAKLRSAMPESDGILLRPFSTSKEGRERQPHGKKEPNQETETNFESELVPVDTRRGKWWLKDRQILAKNIPFPTGNDRRTGVKIRETWLWSGRTVVVDKIIPYLKPAPVHTAVYDATTDYDDISNSPGCSHDSAETDESKPQHISVPKALAQSPEEQIQSVLDQVSARIETTVMLQESTTSPSSPAK